MTTSSSTNNSSVAVVATNESMNNNNNNTTNSNNYDSMSLSERMQLLVEGGDGGGEGTTMNNTEQQQQQQQKQHPEVYKLQELLVLQEQIGTMSLLSLSSSTNESLDEIPTETLQLLCIEHYIAMSYMNLPTNGISDIASRQHNLLLSCTLWNQFLRRLEILTSTTSSSTSLTSTISTTNDTNYSTTTDSMNSAMLSKSELKQYHTLIDVTDKLTQQVESISSSSSSSSTQQQQQLQSLMMTMLSHPIFNSKRDEKIERYRLKQQLVQQQQKLRSLQQRRIRLDINDPNESLDGYDNDELSRSIAFKTISLCKHTALEEWVNVLREIPMILNLVAQQQQNQIDTERMTCSNNNNYSTSTAGTGTGTASNSNRQQQQQQQRGLQLTHITQEPSTGLLRIQKEEIRSTVFQPGWNQPTMSLDELAYREATAAIERDEQQKLSTTYQLTQPRRYNQLVKDEQEDDTNLVDASAILDRQWDDFKDANPRGSGNKRGDVGDRNF